MICIGRPPLPRPLKNEAVTIFVNNYTETKIILKMKMSRGSVAKHVMMCPMQMRDRF